MKITKQNKIQKKKVETTRWVKMSLQNTIVQSIHKGTGYLGDNYRTRIEYEYVIDSSYEKNTTIILKEYLNITLADGTRIQTKYVSDTLRAFAIKNADYFTFAHYDCRHYIDLNQESETSKDLYLISELLKGKGNEHIPYLLRREFNQTAKNLRDKIKNHND